MKTKTIKTDNGYILVDLEGKIKDKEPFLDMRDYPHNISDYDIYWAGAGGTTEFANTIGKKILAAYPPIDGIPTIEEYNLTNTKL